MPLFDQAAIRDAVMASLRNDPPAQTAPASAPHDGIGPWPYVAAISGQGADLASTLIARQRPGVVEANPFYGNNTGAILAGKIGSAALLTLAIKELEATGHATAAKVLGYGSGAVFGGLAARNMTVR